LPELGTGLHRYVFLVLEQSIPISFAASPSSPTPPKSMDYMNNGRVEDQVSSKSPLPQRANSKKQKQDERNQQVQKRDDSTKQSSNFFDQHNPKVYQLSPNEDIKFRLSPTPPPPHRRESIPTIERKKFSTKEFIKKHTIRSIVAGNFFQVNSFILSLFVNEGILLQIFGIFFKLF
jgi:hypothetical protein